MKGGTVIIARSLLSETATSGMYLLLYLHTQYSVGTVRRRSPMAATLAVQQAARSGGATNDESGVDDESGEPERNDPLLAHLVEHESRVAHLPRGVSGGHHLHSLVWTRPELI